MSVGYTLPQFNKITSGKHSPGARTTRGTLAGQPWILVGCPDQFYPKPVQNRVHRYELSQDRPERQTAAPQNLANSENQVDTYPSATILVVEDEMIVALDLRHTLARMGYTVIGIACSGSEAIQQASVSRPDVILMDIHLNDDIDGIEAARQIGMQFRTAIIFLTAQADESTVQRAREAGSIDLLFKPFSESALHVAIEEALGPSTD